MEDSFRFFKNTACRYYPCHEGLAELNCLFCYCPLYFLEDCPGTPEFIQRKDGKTVKSCVHCVFPHRAENYPAVVKLLAEACPVNGSGERGESQPKEPGKEPTKGTAEGNS